MTLQGAILITGGSGTLGHAIARTARAEGWDCRITIYSRSELRQAEMRARFPECRYVLGDVRDADRLTAAFAGHDLIIHAAAMKRIPECEAQPGECIDTNVRGSANVARAALAAGVGRVVGISTDKACAAITTYGASKRMMEGLFQAQPSGRTVFTLCRYGNVLASNGSVIPLWRQQAERGEPLTITDYRMTRFWMTERQAVLTIEEAAGAVPQSITVPRMGAVRIADMAEWIVPGSDTREIGLRSTEKLHEDLVHPCEPSGEYGGTYGDVFVLHPLGDLGTHYTSDRAPRFSRDTFLAMLAESEAAYA